MLPKYFLLVPTALLNDMDLFMQISELTSVEKVEVDEELTLCHSDEMFILYHHVSGDFWPASEFHPLHVEGTAMGDEEEPANVNGHVEPSDHVVPVGRDCGIRLGGLPAGRVRARMEGHEIVIQFEPQVETPLQKVEAIEQGKRLKQVHSALVGMLFAGGVPLDDCFSSYDTQLAAARDWTNAQLKRYPRNMPTNYRV